MAGSQPFDGAHTVQAVAEAVERIAGDAPNAFHTGLFQSFGDQCGYSLLHNSPKRCKGPFIFQTTACAAWPWLEIYWV
ncbi:hypothetical protein D3C72_2495520 [compost metagenome]